MTLSEQRRILEDLLVSALVAREVISDASLVQAKNLSAVVTILREELRILNAAIKDQLNVVVVENTLYFDVLDEQDVSQFV